jgi:hypothetical protein
MKRSMLILLATGAGALACLLLSACGGGSSATPTPPPTPAPTPTLAPSALAGLVLPVQSITVSGIALNLDGGNSGPQTRSKVLDGSFDTQRDSAELDQFGWRAEQQQSFVIPANTATGVFRTNSTIDLLDAADHATQALPLRFNNLTSDVGKTSTDSSGTTAKLDSATSFAPVGFDGSKGVIATLEQGGNTFYITELGFVRGPLLVMVGIASFDQSDQTTAVVDLAKQADTQISTVVKP